MKEVGKQVAWEGFNQDIPVAYCPIVVASRQLDLFLYTMEFFLEIKEILIGFQIRIVFSDSDESPQRLRDLALGSPQFSN